MVGFLEVHFEVQRGGEGGEGGGGIIHVKIMLETSNLACEYTLICSFRKYTF